MANEKKGRISGLFSKVRSSNRWFRKNSDLYQSIVDATNEYTSKMSEPVTLESSRELNEIGEKLKKAANDYLTKRKDPGTYEGKARYNYVEQVSKLIRHSDELRDPDAIRKFQAQGKTLADLVDVERNQKVVDITEKEKTIHGAGASKRIRFEYEGKDGFFTPDDKKEIGKYVGVSDLQNDKIQKLNKEFSTKNKQMWDKMVAANITYENIGAYDSRNPGINENKTLSECIKNLKNLVPAGTMEQFTEKELNEIIKYQREMSKINLISDVEFYAEISDFNKMSKRNTATSRVADMLGMEDKVAKSTNIKVVDKGVEMEGSFMETAKGIDSRSKDGRNKLLSKGEIDLTAGSLQRDLNRMQVLDMVCGQVDRHGGNFFYQVSERPVNGKYQITGIQGIDNDMSFGNMNLGVWKKQLPSISQLTLIDDEMLTSLNEFTPDKIKFTLGEMLNEDEINAVISRRQEILIKARSGQLRVVKANEWGADTLEESRNSEYYKEAEKEMASLPEAKISYQNKIVIDYEKAVERVEEYNKVHPGKEQSMPEKPDHFEEYKKQQLEDYDEKLRVAVAEGKHLDIDEPKGYQEYRNEKQRMEHIDELAARLEKEGAKAIRSSIPNSRNSKAQINEAANRVASDNGLGVEKATQEPTRQPVSLKDDLAPKASNSKLEPKQPVKQAQKQNNGLGMGGK